MQTEGSRRVLVVDDERAVAEGISMTLRLAGYEVSICHGLEAARSRLEESEFSLVITDLYLAAASGRDLLVEVVERYPLTPVVVISGVAGLEEALDCVRAGAVDFLEKPVRAERLLVVCENALRLRSLRGAAVGELFTAFASEAMKTVMRRLAKLASTRVTVLLTGETGTGKDVAARLLHGLSPWGDRPFVKINCGAIPEQLIESELFGHRKGSFTGAVRDSEGRIAAAAGGTLFLDEIGELPASAQVKLLRFLESGEIQRLGDSSTRSVQTRIVAATNRDLGAMTRDGGFREDLYYRVAGFGLHLPPLRERREDIPALADFLLGEIAARHGTPRRSLGDDALRALVSLPLPGNIRSLRSILERAALFGESLVLQAGDLGSDTQPADSAGGLDGILDTDRPLPEVRRLFEAAYLERALERHGGSIKHTAEALGMLPNNLSRRLKELGVWEART